MERGGAARDARGQWSGHRGGMAEHPPVIVYPPSATGGRRVTVHGQIVGLAHGRGEVAALLRAAGFAPGPDKVVELDRPGLIEWRGGDLDTWG
ncbi:hypothetical protein GA0115280_113017 [Streptomyces sp. Cmuel-A718b]|nr:hypothetical protein GA0115280_113017 [Streptomyces sp. Cmuel-A718b]